MMLCNQWTECAQFSILFVKLLFSFFFCQTTILIFLFLFWSNYCFQCQEQTFTLAGLLKMFCYTFCLWFVVWSCIADFTRNNFTLYKKFHDICNFNFKVFGAYCMYISKEYAWQYDRAPMFLIILSFCSLVLILDLSGRHFDYILSSKLPHTHPPKLM